MSQWTHINATFRLDSFAGTKADVIKIIGKPYLPYRDLNGTIDRDLIETRMNRCKLPCGSEGSLEYIIWENPEKSSLAKFTVCIFGDLRDFGDEEDYNNVIKWFDNLCGEFMSNALPVRQASCDIEIEFKKQSILLYESTEYPKYTVLEHIHLK